MNDIDTSLRSKKTTRWQALITEWKTTGLSQSEFCKKNDLKVGDFYAWKKRLYDQENSIRNSLFIPIKFTEVTSPAEQPVLLKLQCGAQVEISALTSKAALKVLLEALGVASC